MKGLYVYSGAEAVVNGGHIFSTSTSQAATPCGAYVSKAANGIAGGEITVNGGTIEGYFCGMNIGGHATINNGTIQAELAYGAYIVGGVDMFGGSVKGGTYGFAVSGVKNADNTVTLIGTVNLSGGSFYGSKYAVFNNLTDGTVAELLGEGHAYYEGSEASGTPRADGMDANSLEGGTFTVGECTHVDADSDGECDICGHVQEKIIATVEKGGLSENYTDINEAWAAALESSDEAPATMTLLESVDLNGQELFMSSGNIILQMADDVELVSDLNGANSGVIRMFGGTLTMKSGIVKNPYSYSDNGNASNYGVGVYLTGTATFNMEGGQVLATGAVDATGIKLYSSADAVVNITGGTVSGTYSGVEVTYKGVVNVSGDAQVYCTSASGRGIYFYSAQEGASLNVSGGTITGGSDTNAYGIGLSHASAEITGGTISGIDVSTKGNANISGATINGTISATNTNGKVSLSDCTVNGRISVWIGGKVDINSGVHIYTTGYDSGIYVGTMGGTVNIYDGVTVETSGYNSHAVEVSTASGTANIYGGSFTSQNGRGLYVRTDATVNLYGGTFSGNRSYGTVDNANTDGTVRDLLAEGHAYYTGEAVDAEQLITSGLDGSKLTQSTVTVGECSHIDEDTSGSCDVCGTMIPIATVSMNGEVTEFGNINEAWAAALEGSDETPATLTLLKSIDMKETNLVLDSDSNIILEMNEGVTLSGNVGDNIGAGTATATITGTGRYGGTASAVFTIEKADPVIGDVFYDGTIYPSTPVESVTLKRDDESIPGALTLAEDSVFIEGESEYRWTFTPEDMANYNTINGTVSLTVTKDTLVKLEAEGEPDKKDYIYEDIFEVNGLTIKAVYASGYSEDVTDKVTASKLNAGDTEVILSYTDGEGTTVHCTISGITVSKRVLDNSGMRWSEETYIYDGTEQGPALNGGLPEGVKVTESGNKAADAGSYEAHAVFELAEGYSSENYALAVENLPAEWSIERRPVTVTPDSGQSKGYGQADPTLTYSADGIVEGEALSGELTRESGEDMGDYKITQGSLTDENNKNYTISFVGDVTFAILEKSITDADVSVSGAFVYNGGEHQPVPTVTMDDKVLTENVDYAVSYENNVNAGDAEIVIRGMGNYGGEVRKSFAIARKEITVTITPNGGVYNGTILPAAAAANDVIDGDDVAVTLIYTGKANDETAVDSEQYPTKAGTYTVTASITNGNYRLVGETTAQFIVDKAEAGLAVSMVADKTYGDGGFKLDVTRNSDGNLTYESSDASVLVVDENGWVDIVGAGKATIIVTDAGSANYYGDSKDVTITVLPKTVTVTADSQKKVYGDKDAELTWKAEGLVGEDQLEGITVTRKAGEAVGEYPITASQSDGMNPDYDLIFVDGSLTIQARDIKDAVVELGDGLAADGKTQTQEIRQVTVQNGDGEALEVTYTVAGNQGMEPGAYTMTLTGNGNFTGTVTKTFVIAPAADSKVDTDTNGDVVIGEGTIGIRVEKDEKAPEVEIKTDQEALIEMLTENGDLTSEELSQIAQGADIRLILEVTGADGAVSEGSRVQIEKAVSGYTIGQYVNVHLFKETSREGEVLNTVQLTETRNNIKISVKVPENLLNKDASVTRTFYIVRNFDGKVEFLPTVYDEAENALIFETNKFADYAIVYKDVKNPVDDKPNGNTTTGNGKKPLNTATGTVPKTGDSMNLGLWFAVMFGACGIVIGSLVYGKRKKKRTHQVNDK